MWGKLVLKRNVISCNWKRRKKMFENKQYVVCIFETSYQFKLFIFSFSHFIKNNICMCRVVSLNLRLLKAFCNFVSFKTNFLVQLVLKIVIFHDQ
jgi:hypothetical protein